MSQNLSVPFHVPTIGEEEINEVVATLRSGWLTSGPRTAQFEQEFRAYVGASHALAVNSCTAGLHLALAALKLGPGDEVITTPLTFCATVNTISVKEIISAAKKSKSVAVPSAAPRIAAP